MFRNADYIYAVYKAKNFSRAAESLHISQSSLSLTVKKAEERIGMAIFNRSTTPLSLTEFGRLYIGAVEDVMHIQNQLETFIYDTEHFNHGHISIGAVNFYAGYLLPRALAAFREICPNITIDLYERPTSDLVKKLTDGTVDLIVTKSILDPQRFKRVELCRSSMLLAIPRRLCHSPALRNAARKSRDDPPAALPDIFSDPNVLEGVPFILLHPGNVTRDCADRLFREIGIRPAVVLEADHASTAYRFACAGLGAAVVSSLIVQKTTAPDSLWLFPIDRPYCDETLYAYMNNGAIAPWGAEQFTRLLRAVISESGGPLATATNPGSGV